VSITKLIQLVWNVTFCELPETLCQDFFLSLFQQIYPQCYPQAEPQQPLEMSIFAGFLLFFSAIESQFWPAVHALHLYQHSRILWLNLEYDTTACGLSLTHPCRAFVLPTIEPSDNAN